MNNRYGIRAKSVQEHERKTLSTAKITRVNACRRGFLIEPDLADVETNPYEDTFEQRLENRLGSWGDIECQARASIERLVEDVASRQRMFDPQSADPLDRGIYMDAYTAETVLKWVLAHWDFVWDRIDQ